MGGTQSSTHGDDGGGVRGGRGERTRTNSRDDDAPATAAPAPAPPTPPATSSPSSSSSSGGAAGEEQQRDLANLRQRLLRPASRVPSAARAEHEKDHALVLDLMEFFCYSVKVGTAVKVRRTAVCLLVNGANERERERDAISLLALHVTPLCS